MRTVIKETIDVQIAPAGDYGGLIRSEFPGLDIAWGDGTSSNQADRFWYDSRTLAGGANETHDLTAMTTGPTGATVAFVEVRAIYIKWPAAADGNANIGHGATNGWTPLVVDATDLAVITPGETFRKVNPVDGKMPVAAGSKTIKIANAGAVSQIYQILVIGTSA